MVSFLLAWCQNWQQMSGSDQFHFCFVKKREYPGCHWWRGPELRMMVAARRLMFLWPGTDLRSQLPSAWCARARLGPRSGQTEDSARRCCESFLRRAAARWRAADCRTRCSHSHTAARARGSRARADTADFFATNTMCHCRYVDNVDIFISNTQ